MLLPARDILSAILRLKPPSNWWRDIGALVATKSVARSLPESKCEMQVQLGASATQGWLINQTSVTPLSDAKTHTGP